MLDLKKDILDLSKKFELNLTKAGFTKLPIMKTKMALDKSGSMSDLYSSGWAKKTVDLFLGAALKFDDDGELDLVYFNGSASNVQNIKLDNYSSFRIGSAGGGTNYVPAIKALFEEGSSSVTGFFGKLFSKPKAEDDIPTYIGFITDGDPSDKAEALQYVDSLKDSNVFIQFIILGNSVDTYLLDKLSKNSNVAYSIISNPSNVTPDEFYSIIANQKLLAWTTK